MSIETFNPTGGVPAVLQPAALPAGIATLRAWAAVASEAAQLVSPLINTAFVPEVFRPRIDPRATDAERAEAHAVAVATATAAVLYGAGLGLDPLQALSSIHVVKGKPGLYAETMVALLKGAGHEVGVEDESDTRVRVWGRRKNSQTIERAEFSIERAKKAGYVAQNKKYDTDPRSMLYARAVSILCRRLAPEVLKGVASVEETVDEPDGSAPPRTRTVKPAPERPQLAGPLVREAAASVALDRDQTHSVDSGPAQPEPPQPQPEPPQPQPEPAPISEMLWRGINDELRELGVNGDGSRGRRLTLVNHLIGRTVGRGSEMTHDEGRLVYDTLRGGHGARLLADVFGETAPAPIVEATVEPELPGQEAAEFDPTTEPGWDDRGDDPEIDE